AQAVRPYGAALAVGARLAITAAAIEVALGAVLQFVVALARCAHLLAVGVGLTLVTETIVVGLAAFPSRAIGAVATTVQVRFAAVDGVVPAAGVSACPFGAKPALTVVIVVALLAVDAGLAIPTAAVIVAFVAVLG